MHRIPHWAHSLDVSNAHRRALFASYGAHILREAGMRLALAWEKGQLGLPLGMTTPQRNSGGSFETLPRDAMTRSRKRGTVNVALQKTVRYAGHTSMEVVFGERQKRRSALERLSVVA
jgi:hypothetical protein